MNSTHGAAAIGGTAFGAALAAVIAATWHIDVGLATNWVIVASGVLGAFGAFVVWWIKWRWPDAPPLPGELLAIPADAPPARVAQVLPPQQVPVVQPQQEPVHAAPMPTLPQQPTTSSSPPATTLAAQQAAVPPI